MKTVKNLLVPFIILVVLIIAAAVYFIVDSHMKNIIDESASGMIEVVYINNSDILNVTVLNSETGYTSRITCDHQSNGDISYSFESDDAESGIEYSQTAMSVFVNTLSSIQCKSKVSDQGNYADYGLDQPSFTVSISVNGDSSTRYFLGNVSPNQDYCYMYVEGSQDIYLVSSDKRKFASSTSVDFLEDQLLQIDYSELDTVTFKRASDNLSLETAVNVNANGIANFNVVKPYNHSASTYLTDLIQYMATLHISEFIVIPEDEKASYGISDPEYHFIFKMKDGKKTELYLSKQISGCYYGYIAGDDHYFRLSGSKISGIDIDETKLIYPYVMDFSPYDISSLTCVYGDSSFKLDFKLSNGTSITSSDADIKLDGRNTRVCDSMGRSYCSVLIESLTSIEIAGICMDSDVDTSEGPVFTISYISKDYSTTVYDFYTRDNGSFYVFKNGKFMNFYVFSEELFKNAGSDTYNYGCWAAYQLLDEAIKGSINGVYDIPENG